MSCEAADIALGRPTLAGAQPHTIISMSNFQKNERCQTWRQSVPVKVITLVQTPIGAWWRTDTLPLVAWVMLSAGTFAGEWLWSIPKTVVAN